MRLKTVQVAVAVIVNAAGQVLISYRNAKQHQGSKWEFPGGKVEQGETVQQALQREISEELNLTFAASMPLLEVEHHYPEYHVCLYIHLVKQYYGEACGSEGQDIRWCAIDQLECYEFPEANQPIIQYLNEHQAQILVR